MALRSLFGHSIPLTVLVAVMVSASAAEALPEGFGLASEAGVRFDDLIDPYGRVTIPELVPEEGWVLIRQGEGYRCQSTAPRGVPPSTTEGPYAGGSAYEALGRPDRVIVPSPGAPAHPIRLLLDVNPPYNVDGFSHGIMTFDCNDGVRESRGLFFPAALGEGRAVGIESDGIVNGQTWSPALRLGSDGQVYARVQDRIEDSEFPFAARFNHLVRWPIEGDASEPELLVSGGELLSELLTPAEVEAFRSLLGWSLRIESFVPMEDGSLWFVVDLNNAGGLRDIVPRSFLLRLDAGGELTRVAAVTNPPVGAGVGPATQAIRMLFEPLPGLPLLAAAPWGVFSTEAPYFGVATPMAAFQPTLVPGHGGYFALTGDTYLAPLVFDPELADFDRDMLSWAAEERLGTFDTSFDTDGDGFHDRHEADSDSLDPLESTDGEVPPVPEIWGFSTRIQTASYATPSTEAWDSTPLFDGATPDGERFDSTLRYAPDGSPSDLATGWALSPELGVDSSGWIEGGSSRPFAAEPIADAPTGFAARIETGISYLGPDDASGGAFVHLPRAWGYSVFRLHPDGRLDFLFDADWYGIAPITSMHALAEHDAVLATSGGAVGSGERRELIVLDEQFVPHRIGLTLTASFSRVVRFFGIGYGVGDQLEGFAGGYATDWISELVASDDVARPGDVIAVPFRGAGTEEQGIYLVREDLTAHRWLAPLDLLGLSDETARPVLEGMWSEDLLRESPSPPGLFRVESIAVAEDGARVCFAGDGRVWELLLAAGRPRSFALRVDSGAQGCAYDGTELAVMRQSGLRVTAETVDGIVLAQGDLDDLSRPPWRLARFGPRDGGTWVAVSEFGALCLGDGYLPVEEVGNVAGSPRDPDAVVWSLRHRIVAGSVSDFCEGRFTELVDRFVGDEDSSYGELGDSFATGRSFWKEIAQGRGETVEGPYVETLDVRSTELVVRPDGGVFVSVREFRPAGLNSIMANPLGGTPYFLGAYHPVDRSLVGVPLHAPLRRRWRGPRIGVALPSLVATQEASFVASGPMAIVPGAVEPGWGEVADLSYAGGERPEPYVPGPPDSDPDAGPGGGADAGPSGDTGSGDAGGGGGGGGCGGCATAQAPAAPAVAWLALGLALAVLRRRLAGPTRAVRGGQR